MFKVGELKDEQALKRVVDELRASGVESQISYSVESELFELSVFEEKDLRVAHEYYRVAARIAPRFEMPKEWSRIRTLPRSQVSTVVIAISVLIYLISLGGDSTKHLINALKISEVYNDFFLELSNGELWRLWTPALLHFGFMHILFNTLWLKDLGKIIELYKGKTYFIIFLIITGILSNIAQYIVQGPNFGGLSGVVYALLGLIWMNKRFDRKSEYFLPMSDVFLMVGWFFLCLFGAVGHVANAAHAVGLTSGMIFGIFSGVKASVRRGDKIENLALLKFSVGALFVTLLTFIIEYYKLGKNLFVFIYPYL